MCKQILLRQICPCTKAPSKEIHDVRVPQSEISPCCMLGTDIALERKTRMGLAARRGRRCAAGGREVEKGLSFPPAVQGDQPKL